MNTGRLQWLGPTNGSLWRKDGPKPPTTSARVEWHSLPVHGTGWVFVDLDRRKAVYTSRVRDVMEEGKDFCFSTENSRYKLTRD